MNAKRICELTFRDDSYEIVSEDMSSASVSPSTGLVSIETPGQSLPDWCLSPEHVMGFESTQTGDGSGRSIFLAFRTDAGEKHRLYLGVTSDVGAAESWVARVNSIYPQSQSLANRGSLAIAQLPPRSGTPFLDEVIETTKITLMPGIYGNMIPRGGAYARPKAYEPAWLTAYAQRALRTAQDVTRHGQELKLERAYQPGLDTSALMFTLDLIRPHALRDRKTDDSPRAVLSGEFLFEQALHRPQIKVLELSEATHLALVIRRGSRFQKTLKRPRSSFRGPEKDASLADWLKALLRCQRGSSKVPIVTLEREVAAFHLMDTLTTLKGEDQAFSRFAAGSVESIAELLHRFRTDEAVAVCDVGIANELLMYYAYFYGDVRSSFLQLHPRYREPVKVGLGLPKEDPVWCEICAQALKQTLEDDSEMVRTSLMETKMRVEKSLGMQWTLAAA